MTDENGSNGGSRSRRSTAPANDIHSLTVAVARLEQGFEELRGGQLDLAKKLDQQRTRRPSPLAVIGTTAAALAVLITIAMAVMSPFNSRISVQEQYNRDALQTLTRFAAAIEAHGSRIDRNESDMSRLSDRLDGMRSNRFTREEYQFGRDSMQRDIDRLYGLIAPVGGGGE